MALLQGTDLVAGYGGHQILAKVSLSLAAGEFWGILAPNGAGKTTLLKTLAGVLPVLGGDLLFGGKEFAKLSRREAAQQIAVVGADVPHTEYTVEQIVFMGRFPHLQRLQAPGRQDYLLVEEAIETVGLWEKRQRRCRELSQGERQKTVIARALAQEPKLLLLDEPTAHLDLYNQAVILGLIRKLTQECGLAVAAVLHDINLALQFSSHLLLLHGGTVLAQGNTADLLTAKMLHKMYGLEFRVQQDSAGTYVRPLLSYEG